MKKTAKWAFALLLLVAVTVAAAGCGSQPASQQQSQAASQAPRTITVASDTTYAPFEYQDKDTGKYVGFDIDLMDAIGKINNWQINWRSMNFDGIVPALQSSSVDAAISAMTIKPDREKVVNFSIPYYQSGQSIMVLKKNTGIKGWDDLKGKKIGVQLATTGADLANKVPNAKVTTYDNIDDAFLALENGNIDAVVNDYPVNAYYIVQGHNDVQLVGGLQTTEFYGIAVPKDKPDILAKVNSALKTLKDNGQFAQIYQKWFGKQPPDFLPGQPPANQ